MFRTLVIENQQAPLNGGYESSNSPISEMVVLMGWPLVPNRSQKTTGQPEGE